MQPVPIHIANDPDRLTNAAYHNSQTEEFHMDNVARKRLMTSLIIPMAY